MKSAPVAPLSMPIASVTPVHLLSRAAARGVTLIELMVVIAIAAILIGIGVPNLSDYIWRNRLDTASNELLSDLQFARSEALRRGQPVTLRLRAAAGSGDWGSAGRTTFLDVNGNATADAGDETLRDSPAQAGGLTIYGSADFVTALTFGGDGRLRSGAGAFVLCDSAQQLVVDGRSHARAISVSASGRVRQWRETGDADKVPDTDTGPVTNCRTP